MITVYVPCYNSEKTIAKCILSLLDQSLKPGEIIIVDDGCTDNTIEIAKTFDVKIIHHEKNLGIAAARNTGLKNAKYDIVAGLDSDNIADTDWLQKLHDFLTNNQLSLAGGNMKQRNSNIADKWRNKHLVQTWGDEDIINPKFITGNNFICFKKNILDIGGYDEKYKTNYEDVDISFRLIRHGYNIGYTPRCQVTHLTHDTPTSVLDKHWRYTMHDYPLPTNLFNKIRRIPIFTYIFLKYFLSDMFGQAELNTINLAIVPHHIKKDFVKGSVRARIKKKKDLFKNKSL